MGVNTRYEMPACLYHRQATVLNGGNNNPENQHGRLGLVRIHNPQQDRCRRFITIGPEVGFVSSDEEATKTFNRGSLIHYLNSELRHFGDKPFLRESNPLPRRLHVGWFGGLIRGSSDERIQEACRAVFARYGAFKDRTKANHQINEHDLFSAQLSFIQPENYSVELHSDEYLDGAVRISVNAMSNSAQQFDFCMQNGYLSDSLNIYIRLQDSNVDVARIMQAISEITFSGTAAENFRNPKIYLALAPSHEEWSESDRSLILSTKMREISEWQTQKLNECRRRNPEDYGTIENAYLVREGALDRVVLASEAARIITLQDNTGEGIAYVRIYNLVGKALSMLFPYILNGDRYVRITICDPRVVNEEPQQILGEVINLLKCALADISNASGDVINVGLIRILISQQTIPDKNARRAKELALQRIFNEKEWVLPSV